jgi:hypothetical protein
VAPEKPKPPKSIYREVLRLGEVTKRREVFLKDCVDNLETARLDHAGTGSIEHGALYSLDAKGQEGIGRMIAAYKLRDARRAAAAAGSGRGGALRDAAVAPRAAGADAAGPLAAAAPSRRQPTRRARTPPVDDMFVYG